MSAAISIDDRLALQELTHKYAFYCDTKKLEPLMALFTPDAALDETHLGLGRSEGLGQIRDAFVAAFAAAEIYHVCGNQLIEEASDNAATGICFVHAECQIIPSGATIRSHGYFQDEYVKDGGVWRFKSRTIFPILKPDLGSFLDAL